MFGNLFNSFYDNESDPMEQPSYYRRPAQQYSPFSIFGGDDDYDYEETIRRRELERRQREKQLQEQRKRDAELLAQERQRKYEAEMKRRQMEEYRRQQEERRAREEAVKRARASAASTTGESVITSAPSQQMKNGKKIEIKSAQAIEKSKPILVNETTILSQPENHKVEIEKTTDADFVRLNVVEAGIDKNSIRIDVDGQRKLVLRAKASLKENEESSSISEDEEFDQCESVKNRAFGEIKTENQEEIKKSITKCLYWNFTLPSSLVDRTDISASFQGDDLVIEIPKIANPEKDVMRIIINN